MLFTTLSAAVYGIDANLIDVEVDIGPHPVDKENFMTVGLPDAAVRESRQRIQAALKNCGFEMPRSGARTAVRQTSFGGGKRRWT